MKSFRQYLKEYNSEEYIANKYEYDNRKDIFRGSKKFNNLNDAKKYADENSDENYYIIIIKDKLKNKVYIADNI